jgi:hypothetical protein
MDGSDEELRGRRYKVSRSGVLEFRGMDGSDEELRGRRHKVSRSGVLEFRGMDGSDEEVRGLKPLVSAITNRISRTGNLLSGFKSLAKQVFTPLFKKRHLNESTRRTRQSEFSRDVYMLLSYCQRENVEVTGLSTDQIVEILIAEKFSWRSEEGNSFRHNM